MAYWISPRKLVAGLGQRFFPLLQNVSSFPIRFQSQEAMILLGDCLSVKVQIEKEESDVSSGWAGSISQGKTLHVYIWSFILLMILKDMLPTNHPLFSCRNIFSGFLFLCFEIWLSCTQLNPKEFVDVISKCCFPRVFYLWALSSSEGGDVEFKMKKFSLGSLFGFL